jgi:2,5-diamino-6-(ribosylamino)-4(3H)-pyrimidinone 5'-phosphate reductase
MAELREMGIRRLMVEGGGRLNYSMVASGLVDEIRVTIAPYAFGSGVSLLEGPGFEGERERVRLALRSVRVLCEWWVHLVYDVLWPKRPLS